MRLLLSILLSSIFCLLSTSTKAQGLYHDAKRLNQLMIDQVQWEDKYRQIKVSIQHYNKRASLDSIQQVEFRHLQGSMNRVSRQLAKNKAQTLAILDHYQQWSAKPSPDDIQLMAERSLKAYQENDELYPLLLTHLQNTTAPSEEVFKQEYLATREQLKSGKDREKILELLTSSYPQSPREYLSVRKTLQDYQEPPLSNLDALQAATKESNRNVNQGLPNERELIIGLFTFLMERAQEEVIINFLERLLGKNGIQQFKELFPSTSTAFEDLSFNFSDSFVARLRQAFYEDVQLLSVSIPSLLTNPKYFQLLEEDPIAYSFMQLYTMIGMGQQGVPITEIVPFTFRNVFDVYQDKRKKINLKIAKTFHQSSAYKKLRYSTQGIINDIVDISLAIDEAQQITMDSFNKLSSQLLAIDSTFGPITLTSTDVSYLSGPTKNTLLALISHPVDTAAEAVDINLFIRKLKFDEKEISVDSFIRLVNKTQKEVKISNVNNELHFESSLRGIPKEKLQALAKLLDNGKTLSAVPLSDAEYQGLSKLLNPDDGYSLKLLPSLLDAKFDASLINSWSTVATYDQFLRDTLSQQQMRAAGLALARRLNGAWYNDMNIADMLREWQKEVVNYHSLYIQKKDELFPQQKFEKEKKAYLNSLKNLKQVITKIQDHYAPASDSYDYYRLEVLARIIKDSIFNGHLALTDADLISQGLEEIAEVEERLFEVESQLSIQNPNSAKTSPILKYFEEKKENSPLQAAAYKIDSLEMLLDQLQKEIQTLDKELVQPELDAVRPISPIVQITEALSHLMYCMRDEKSPTGWLQRTQLNEALLDREIAPIFLGLLGQQLKQSKVEGSFAMAGLTQFIRMSLEDLNYMRVKEYTKDSINISFFKKAAFVNLTLNRLLSMPLFIDKTDHTQAKSLLSSYKELAPIPKLSDLALQFIYHTNIKDHRHAITSFIRLLTEIMQVTDDRAKLRASSLAANPAKQAKLPKEIKPYKPSQALAFMKKYGYFMADLIDADSSAQVKTLLEGIADPPGSSRVKRREPFTANINGYVGILAGSETLRKLPDPNKSKQNYATFAPTLPVGISLSKLVGKGPKPESFSLFLSVLDLGSLTTYSLSDDLTGENQISFKNILKPGLQLHWNIQNSPFFLGIGAQTGPRFREFNGEQRSLQATTFFFNMGIDVVIKRLY